MNKVVQVIPAGDEVARLRSKMKLTQTELGDLFGLSLRQWQRKESLESTPVNNSTPMKVGEANFLLLLADEHPYYRLEDYHPDKVIRTGPLDEQEVRQLRIESGLMQKEIAAVMGYTLYAWKSKESPNNRGTLKPGEYNFLMLLTGVHPKLKMTEK